MSEIKLLEKNFNMYGNSFIIEYIIDGVKYVYDIRLKFNSIKLEVAGYGVKTGKQREFRYGKIDGLTYRGLDKEARKEYELNYYKENIPAQVVNLAFEECIKSITYDKF